MGTLRSRLLKSLAASALGPVITSAFQVLTVPLYLHAWGTRLYGEWIILSAVPAYLALTDFGFASVAANTMTMDVARNRKEHAIVTFQSAWALTAIVAPIVLALVLLATLFPLSHWLRLTVMTPSQVKIIFVLLSVQVLVGLQSSMNLAGFRCDGNYAFGTFSVNMVRLVETIAVSAAVLFKATPVTVAATTMTVRIVGTGINRMSLARKSPWLKFGFRQAQLKVVKELFGPALAYLAFPIGDSIGMQGTTLAAGMVLGPIAVVTFNTLRTLTRLVVQAIRIIMYSFTPEISAAYGSGNFELTRKLHRVSCQLSLWTSMVASIALLFSGDFILRVWTHNRVPMNHPTFYMLLAVVVANSVWHGSSANLTASNRHNRAAIVFVIVSTASLGLALVLMKYMGLPGAAAALLLIDVLYGSYVIRVSLKMLDESLWSWLYAVLHFPGRLPTTQKAISGSAVL